MTTDQPSPQTESAEPLIISEYDRHHCRVLAYELTAAAGVPLRDRYGFAADDAWVDRLIEIVAANPDDAQAAEVLGLAVYVEDLHFAEGYDTPTSEEYERRIVAAVRPLIDQRIAARERSRRREPAKPVWCFEGEHYLPWEADDEGDEPCPHCVEGASS